MIDINMDALNNFYLNSNMLKIQIFVGATLGLPFAGGQGYGLCYS